MAYELVGPTWQLNAINVHVPFGDATDTFLEHLMEAYRQLAMMGRTVIKEDFNAAPSADNRGGRQTPEDTPVRMSMQHMALQDLTTSYEASPHTDHRSRARQMPASTPATRTRHTSRWHGRNTTTCRPRSPDIDPWRYKSRYSEYPRPPGKTWTTKNNHPLGHQMSTTHTNGRRITARAANTGPTRRDRHQPCHETSGHGVRPPRTATNTGQRHPTSRPTVPGYSHMARQAGTTHGSALTRPASPT